MLLQDIVRHCDHSYHLALELLDAVAELKVFFADLQVLLLQVLCDHQIEVLLMTIAVDHVKLDIGVWFCRTYEIA